MKPRVLLYCPTYKLNGKAVIKPETRKSIKTVEFDGVVDKVINSNSEHKPPDYENVLVHYQKARKKVLDEKYDALLTVEHDIVIPKDGLQKLWDLDVPVAYGIYLFRGSKNIVNAFRMVNATNPDMSLTAFKELLAEALEKGVVEVSGCGNGCTLIRREVLEQINFRRNRDGNPIPDMPFATDCLKAGIKQYAHFGVQCGHVLDNKTIWLDIENNGTNMTKVNILQNFVGSDGISYTTGEVATIPDDLVCDYSRAGFVKIPGRSFVIKDPSTKPVVSIRHHQNKAVTFEKALKNCGYNVLNYTKAPKIADMLLIDHDVLEYGHGPVVQKFYDAGKPVFIYPHGAAPMLCWDGIHEPTGMVTATFVTSKGHAEVMKRYGYPGPTHVIGWHLCPQVQWKATKGIKVLFAPIHPILGHVFMFPEDLEVNHRTYERLLELDGIELSVRHIGKLDDNGLWEEPGVETHQGRTDNTYDDIDNADMVISNGTMAYMAVARGKPTIMMNQMTPAREPDINTLERYEAASVEKYEKYMRFPFDVDNKGSLQKIVTDACKREPKQWRKRFIGEQFDPIEFCELIGELARVE